MELQETFLRAILATVARQTFSPARILEIMGPTAGEKQHRAFNLCDGSRTQADISKELGLDPGNFSKSLNRWIDEGIVIRVGEKREARPLHVYPLPEALIKKGTKK
ncbi:MarR family transcriptional regulator [Shumkonia mesophila]|uniref:MarR family transcriptional regulator n=1 Tax=Shumkonia mesophila TaxID=2838854 RepID=UPI002934DE78|nr:helix-turn-helix domain-containing protein [Shumkonia mesophila]